MKVHASVCRTVRRMVQELCVVNSHLLNHKQPCNFIRGISGVN